MLARRASTYLSESPGVDLGHWSAPWLRFAVNVHAMPRRPANLIDTGRETFAPNGSTPIVLGKTGFGVRSAAADERWIATLRDSTPYRGNLTIAWRGVFLGAGGTGNYSNIFGLIVGTGSTSPYGIFSIQRNTSADVLSFLAGAGTYTLSDTNIGLSAHYGKPVTLVASNVAGTQGLTFAIAVEGRAFSVGLNTFSAATSNPRDVSGTDSISFGEAAGADRFPNCIGTAGAVWNRAFGRSELLDLASNFDSIFAGPSRVLYLASGEIATTAPEIGVSGNTFDITDGDSTPSATDHTDFGTTPQGTTKSRTFTISNLGDADLVISSVALSGTDAAEFTITTNPTGTIAPSGTGTLVVRADADNLGTFAATVTINSNDANEAAFDFAIAVVVEEAPAADESGGGGALFGTLGSIQMSPVKRRRRGKGKGFF